MQHDKHEAQAMYTYDVALSYASEDRACVDRVAKRLKDNGLRVFYDIAEKAEMLGEDLYDKLIEIYCRQSQFVVPFISKHYANKEYTKDEHTAIQVKISEDKEKKRVFPLRIDDTPMKGRISSLVYLDLRTTPPEECADVIIEKIKRSGTVQFRATPDGLRKQQDTAESVRAVTATLTKLPVDKALMKEKGFVADLDNLFDETPDAYFPQGKPAASKAAQASGSPQVKASDFGRAASPVLGAGRNAAILQEGFTLKQPEQTPPDQTDSTRPTRRLAPKAGRNDPCPCGSGRKYKHCCGSKQEQPS